VVFPDDQGVRAVAAHFGVGPDALLGHGGEAWVYSLGDDSVLRILHAGGRTEDIGRRKALIDELRQRPVRFALPEVLDVGEVAGRVWVIERRLPGRSVRDVLTTIDGPDRSALIETYFETVASLGDLHLEPRLGFGDLVHGEPITAATWRAYLEQRAATNLASSAEEFWSIDAEELANALPEAVSPAFVHLDAYVGNVLTDGTAITAVIDFGSTCVVGDRRLDPLSAVVYLGAPEITPTARPSDVDVGMS
jgi:putative membrane protein